ncbi:N-acetylmuramoyl-L-alanine amidase [Priestia megaterium]|uniref:N-acetylmuramoyl-L-alanine amidase n=1 Tax=Priestia megaterium TaxID=1404 RepID=UPI000BFBCA84|nr:hypothetical protein CN981_09345 [Priestia megaterium]
MAIWQNKFIDVNKYARSGKKIQAVRKIVIHWTANNGASAENHYRYFSNLRDRYASAHFFVDKSEAICIIPLSEVAYHANDVQQRDSKGNPYRGVAELKPDANYLSLGIEMCVEKDGTFHADTIKRAEAVAVELCKRYKLNPSKDIVRHYDVTKKSCPTPWIKNTAPFTAFKQNVSKGATGASYVSVSEDATPLIRKGDQGSAVEKLQKALSDLGYKLAVDGIFGSGTQDDVKDFQKKNGLTADGIVGDATWAKLIKPAKVENPLGSLVIKVDVLNIRRDADVNSPITGKALKGSKFPVYGHKDGMYRIATEGGKWVSDNEKYVEYTPVKVEKVEEDIFYRVVVGSFTTRQEAEDRIAKLKAKKVDSFIMIFEKDDITYYRVVAGSYGERKNADDAVANLAKLGFESFLVAFTK